MGAAEKLNEQLLTEPELMRWSGAKQRQRLMRWLSMRGISYHLNAANQVCTTLEAINASLRRSGNDEVEFL